MTDLQLTAGVRLSLFIGDLCPCVCYTDFCSRFYSFALSSIFCPWNLVNQRVSSEQFSVAMNQPSETPALAPPPGVIPNFVHPASIRKYNILCQAICLPLSTVFVCMRMYTRSYVSRNLGAEDCILLSLRSLSSSELISNRYMLCRMGRVSNQCHNRISRVADTF